MCLLPLSLIPNGSWQMILGIICLTKGKKERGSVYPPKPWHRRGTPLDVPVKGFVIPDPVSRLFDLFYPADLAAFQTDFYAVRVRSRTGQNIFDDPFRHFSGVLVCLHDYRNSQSRFDCGAVCTVHGADTFFSSIIPF